MEATTTASIPDASNAKTPDTKKQGKVLKRFKQFIKPAMKDSDE